jgi:hypothetical protein
MSNLPSYHSANYRREFNTDEFVQSIVDKVVVNLGRNLSPPEMRETRSFIRKMDPDLLAPRYFKKTVGIMASTLSSSFKSFDCTKPQDLNIQQKLKQTIGISSESGTSHSIYDNPSYQLQHAQSNMTDPIRQINHLETFNENIETGMPNTIDNLLGLSNINEAVRIINPSSLLRKNYIMLDSRYRLLDGDVNGKIKSFKWTYIIHSQASAQGTVNIIGNVRDIVSMRVYPFRIPYVESADNKYSRISVLIEEFAQSFIAHEDRKFHFMLQSEIDTAFINLLTDKFNDGHFHFEKPVSEIKSLTVSFGSPIEKIEFDRDRDNCYIDYFSLTPLTKISTGVPGELNKHNLSNGDRVYFSRFDIGELDPALLQQISINKDIKKNINRTEGFLITVIDDFNFSIDYDTSNIQNPLPDTLAVPLLDIFVFHVFYGSKRVFLPLELTYIRPETGNLHN